MSNTIQRVAAICGLVCALSVQAGPTIEMDAPVNPLQATVVPSATKNRFEVAFEDGRYIKFSVATHVLTRLYLSRDAIPVKLVDGGEIVQFTNYGKYTVMDNVLNMDGVVEATEVVIENGRIYLR